MIIALMVALAASASAEVPSDQIAALKELFISTDGPAWLNSTMWNVGNPCDGSHHSLWYGLQCSPSGELYVACAAGRHAACLAWLELGPPPVAARVGGTCSAEMYLGFNQLQGSVPEGLERLTSLR
jgi:hypothetical protein